MNTVVSNTQRKYRASRPDGIAMPSKGNRNSSFAGQIAQRDTQPAFHGQRYQVRPFEDVEGVWFDAQPRRTGIVPGAEKTARKAAPKTGARKARSRRQDPGAGTRPSLSTMRRKG